MLLFSEEKPVDSLCRIVLINLLINLSKNLSINPLVNPLISLSINLLTCWYGWGLLVYAGGGGHLSDIYLVLFRAIWVILCDPLLFYFFLVGLSRSTAINSNGPARLPRAPTTGRNSDFKGKPGRYARSVFAVEQDFKEKKGRLSGEELEYCGQLVILTPSSTVKPTSLSGCKWCVPGKLSLHLR